MRATTGANIVSFSRTLEHLDVDSIARLKRPRHIPHSTSVRCPCPHIPSKSGQGVLYLRPKKLSKPQKASKNDFFSRDFMQQYPFNMLSICTYEHASKVERSSLVVKMHILAPTSGPLKISLRGVAICYSRFFQRYERGQCLNGSTR